MLINVKGQSIYAYTGGKKFEASKPTMIFIHGVLNDHSVWILQSRFFANHGWNVLAIDLPGYCKSSGTTPRSVEAAAKFIEDFMDAADLKTACLVGHSWGSLIALEAAAILQERICQLVLIGIAFPMRVSKNLLETSSSDPMKAWKMVNIFSRSTLAPPPSSLGPGTWVYGSSMALGKRVLLSNTSVNLFHTGFLACDQYAGGKKLLQK